jgi:hypothetical protein
MTLKRTSCLLLALASCTGAQPSSGSGGAAPAGKKKPRRPGVDEWFTPAGGKAPVDLAGTPASGLVFTEFRRGRFRVWHARAVPGKQADAAWLAVRAKGADLVPILVRDAVFDEGYHGPFINAGGAVEHERNLSLQQALLLRDRQLGERAGRMRASLASATPSEGYRRNIELADRLFQQLWSDPEMKPFDVALSVYRGPIEDVTPFLVSGAGVEPRPAELAAALRHWRDRYGAVPRRWERGNGLELVVDRPPRGLAELREVAWQFYLMCPAAPGAVVTENEPPEELLVRVGQRTWDCGWHVP